MLYNLFVVGEIGDITTNLDDSSVREPKNALLALIPYVQEVGIAGGGNIAIAFVNGAI